MVAHQPSFHLDADVFRRLLEDRLSSRKKADVTTHIESCDACQEKLEMVAAEQISWDDVRRYLLPEENDFTTSMEDVNTGPTSVDVDESVPEFLQPSDVPGSLSSV